MGVLTIIIFVLISLSLATERILLWVSRYRRQGEGHAYFFFMDSLMVGFAFSLLLRIDLLSMILDIFSPFPTFGWSRAMTTRDYFTLLPGAFLSACLISGGAQWLRNLLQERAAAGRSGEGLHYQPAGMDIARLAIVQNDEMLRARFSNIYTLLPAFFVGQGRREPCVDICIRDGNSRGLPHHLHVEFPDHREGSVRTRIITNFKNAKPHAGRGSIIVNDSSTTYIGTVGCIVTDNQANNYALTCNHVLTGGDFASPGAIGAQADELVGGVSQKIGSWVAGVMNDQVDGALVKLDPAIVLQSNGLSTTIYAVSDHDCSVTGVAMRGALSGEATGYIIHINQPFEIDYTTQSVTMTGLITLSTDFHANNFSTLTQEGDSGSVVYHAVNKQIIGIVVGGNDQFTLIMPMQQVLASFPGYSLSIAK